MLFTPLKLLGTFLIEPAIHEDNRGSFYRTFCANEFQKNHLISKFVQSNISFNKTGHTLRGLHYQAHQHQETKLVQCINGSVWDVIVDIRQNSSTYGQWEAVELSVDNCKVLYVPEGFAHGFITLEDNCRMLYYISEFYSPDNSTGIRWDDKDLAIQWPHDPSIISDNDASLPTFESLQDLGPD